MIRHTMLLAGIWCVAGCAALDTETYLMQVVALAPTPPVIQTPAPTQTTAAIQTPAPTQPGIPCPCFNCFDDIDLDNSKGITLSECAVSNVMRDNCTFWLSSLWDLDNDTQLDKEEFQTIVESYPEVCKPPPTPNCHPECCSPGYYYDCDIEACTPCFGGVTPIDMSSKYGPVRIRCVKQEKSCTPPLVDIGDFDTCGCLEEGMFDEDHTPGSCDIPLSRAPAEVNLQVGSVITLTRRKDPKHVCPGLCPNETVTDQETVEITAIDSKTLTVSPCPCGGYTKGDEVVHTCKWTDGTNANPAELYSRKCDENGDFQSVCQCGLKQCKPHQMCYCPPEVNFGKGDSTQTCANYTKRDVAPPCCECLNITTWPPIPTPGPSVGAKGDPHLVNLQGEHFDINHGGDFTLLRIPQDVEKPAEIQVTATVTPEFGKPCITYITQAEVSGSWLGNTSVQLRCYRKFHPNMVDAAFLGARVLGQARGVVPWSGIEAFLSDEPELALTDPASQTEVTLSKSQWFPKRKTAEGVPTVAGMFTFNLRNKNSLAEARFVIRQDLPEQEHLNLVVKKLSALGRVDVGGLLGFDEHPQKLEQISAECYAHRATHRIESQEDNEYSYKPAWKQRWEKIRAQKQNQAKANPEEPVTTDAGASLVEHEKNMVCKCSRGGDTSDEGIIVEEMTARFAEAFWD